MTDEELGRWIPAVLIFEAVALWEMIVEGRLWPMFAVGLGMFALVVWAQNGERDAARRRRLRRARRGLAARRPRATRLRGVPPRGAGPRTASDDEPRAPLDYDATDDAADADADE